MGSCDHALLMCLHGEPQQTGSTDPEPPIVSKSPCRPHFLQTHAPSVRSAQLGHRSPYQSPEGSDIRRQRAQRLFFRFVRDLFCFRRLPVARVLGAGWAGESFPFANSRMRCDGTTKSHFGGGLAFARSDTLADNSMPRSLKYSMVIRSISTIQRSSFGPFTKRRRTCRVSNGTSVITL